MGKLAIHGGTKAVPGGLGVRWPVITEEDRKLVNGVLDSGIVCGTSAPQVSALEREWRQYVGTRYCLATNSGTSALHIAVAAAGVGPGDEVITTAFTFIATALSILHHNGIPIFVDIDPVTLNIDPKKIEEKITGRTKAIIPVHIHGIPANMDEINAIAKKHGLVVIEDAAQAHGAEYKGKKVGSLGDMGMFSLNATKNLSCGEGGLFVTNSKKYRDYAAMVRLDGEASDDPGDVEEAGEFDPTHPLDDEMQYTAHTVGWMYLTQELPAAFTRGQLRRLDASNANAIRNANYLTSRLTELTGITPPGTLPDRTHVYHKFRVRLHPEEVGYEIPATTFRDLFLRAIKAEGVEAVLWQTMPLAGQPLFQQKSAYGKGFPWSCQFAREVEYRAEDYPETCRLLDHSVVIGSQSYPLFPQPLELMEHWANAIEKVIEHAGELVDEHVRQRGVATR